MTISDKRIERAAKEIADRRAWYDGQRDWLRQDARAALEADAPEIAAAELRGRIEGLKEAQVLSPIDDDAAMFTVHRERERLHNAIDARLASLQPEVATREDGV